jgi:hypothetical protein
MLKNKFRGITWIYACCGVFVLLLLALFWLGQHTPETKSDESREVGLSVPGESFSAVEFLARKDSASLQDYPELVLLLLASGDASLMDEWLPKLLLQWMEENPRSLLAFLHEMEVDDPSGQRMLALAPWILDVLPDLNDRMAGSLTVMAILERLIANSARQDPEQALAWAREWLIGRGFDSALATIILHLVPQNSTLACDLIGEIETVPNRLAASLAVATYLGATDPEEGIRWAEALPHSADRAYALSGVLAAMAAKAPAQAASIYAEKASGIQAEFTALVLAEREELGWDLQDEFEGMTLEQAREALLNLPDPNVSYFRRAALEIGQHWGEQDPTSAMEWARSIPVSQGGDEARAAVLDSWAAHSPQAAWHAFQQESAPSALMAHRLFQSWAVQQPSSAAQAVVEVPAGPARQAAIQGYLEGWADHGAGATTMSQWAGNLPTSEDRDVARQAIAEAEFFDNPILAWQQIQQITNPRRKQEAFAELFPSLAETNPGLARQALNSVPLPTVQREYFETMLPVAEQAGNAIP